MKWMNINEKLPKEQETVWLYDANTGRLVIGCLFYTSGEWIWAEQVIYARFEIVDGRIETNCDISDIEPTHWHSVPKSPERKEK